MVTGKLTLFTFIILIGTSSCDYGAYDDDLIDAVVYAYICRLAFDHKHPNLPHSQTVGKKKRYKLMMNDNFQMTMQKRSG